jgi:hypothetical protein
VPMTPADQALSRQPSLEVIRTPRGAGSDVRCGVRLVDRSAQRPAVCGHGRGRSALADDAEAAVDARARFVAERRQGNGVPSGRCLNLPSIRCVRQASISFFAAAAAAAAVAGLSGQISSAVLPALIATFSASVVRCLPRRNEA